MLKSSIIQPGNVSKPRFLVQGAYQPKKCTKNGKSLEKKQGVERKRDEIRYCEDTTNIQINII